MVIVDSNCLSHVFNKNDQMFSEFEDLYNFIISKKGMLVWGGTTYISELKNSESYLALYIEFEKSGISKKYQSKPIDDYENYLYTIIYKKSFNDAHIIALQVSSRARIICSVDNKAFPYFKNKIDGKNLYPKGHRRPRIFSSKDNKDLLYRN